jgi:peptide/nickel transport system substrate-binding protein
MRVAVLAAAVTVALAVAGCAVDSGSNGGKLTYAKGGTFTTTIAADPGNLNPLLTTDQVANQLNSFTYDTLINLDASGKPIPQLASSWQVTATAVTFTLRKDVLCADGSRLTPDQVAANFNFIKNPKNHSSVIGSSVPDTNFSVHADDAAGTVRIQLAAPYGFLLTGVGTVPIVCAKGIADPKSLEHGTDGTGPFTLVQSVPSDHYTFAARKGYRWGPHGATTATPGFPEKVVFKVVQSEPPPTTCC